MSLRFAFGESRNSIIGKCVFRFVHGHALYTRMGEMDETFDGYWAERLAQGNQVDRSIKWWFGREKGSPIPADSMTFHHVSKWQIFEHHDEDFVRKRTDWIPWWFDLTLPLHFGCGGTLSVSELTRVNVWWALTRSYDQTTVFRMRVLRMIRVIARIGSFRMHSTSRRIWLSF